MLVPVQSFTPDTSIELGNCRDVVAMLPTLRGMVTAPVIEQITPNTLAGITGIDTLQTLDNYNDLYASTATGIHKWDGVNWSSKRTGLTTSAETYFCAFENSRLAVNKANVIQRATTTGGSFSDIAGSPRCRILERVGLYVVAFDIVDGTWGTWPDGWWTCAETDCTVWDPTNQTVNRGRLYATPGPVVAAKALGDRIVAYKATGVYVGDYVGPPDIIRWNLAAGDEGAVSPYAVALIYPGGRPAHFVVGPRRMFIFDGASVKVIGVGEISEWFYGTSRGEGQFPLESGVAAKVRLVVDAANHSVYIFYSQATSNFEHYLVYNYANGRWGSGRYQQFAHVFPYCTETQGLGYFHPGVIHADKIHTLTGLAGLDVHSQFALPAYGDDNAITTVRRLRPRFIKSWVFLAQTTHRAADVLNQGWQASEEKVSPYAENRIDVMSSNRWHQDTIRIDGHTEITSVEITVEPRSKEGAR